MNIQTKIISLLKKIGRFFKDNVGPEMSIFCEISKSLIKYI